jgi:esterase/lipase
MRRVVALAGSVGLAVVALVLAWPLDTGALVSRPRPATSYSDALERVQSMQARDGADVNPLCATRLLTHGAQTARSVVLFHGFADCVEQFGQFGALLFEQGYNVLIPRAPHHGAADPMSTDLGNVTAAELAGMADEATDIARGLGRHVTVMGLSMGGVMAGFVAQERHDVDRAVLLAPGFVMGGIPAVAAAEAAKALLLMPNMMRYFNDNDPVADPTYASPRYPTRGVAAILTLGAAVRERAKQAPLAAASLVLVTNAADTQVDNDVAKEVALDWAARAPARVATYEFPAGLGLGHDLMDPVQKGQHTDVAYPVLLDLVTGT